MADPLSVAASVAGLLSLAGTVYSALDSFISDVRGAPSFARDIQSEVNAFRNLLTALHSFLDSSQFQPQRAALIPAEYMVLSCTDAVLLFSEIESVILPLARSSTLKFVDKTLWTRKKSKILKLISRLQWQKSTLSLQLNILKCASESEANKDLATLTEKCLHKLAANSDLERRLETVEAQLSLSTTPRCETSSIHTANSVSSDSTARPPPSSNATNFAMSQEFEESLSASWVYRRCRNRDENLSFRISIIRPSAWSALSELSLADISVVSVLALPVQLQELVNHHWYVRDENVATAFAQDPKTQAPRSHEHEHISIQLPHVDGPEGVVARSLRSTNNESLSQGLDETSWKAEASLYEDEDEEEEFSCKGCGEVLEEGDAFELAGDRWHTDCFRCNTCGALLDSDTNLLLLGDGSLICNSCIHDCSACGNRIEDLAILTKEEAFCAGCFRCRNCKRKIENLRYARTSQGIFCMDCHEALMARRRRKKALGKSLPSLPPNVWPSNGPMSPMALPETMHAGAASSKQS